MNDIPPGPVSGPPLTSYEAGDHFPLVGLGASAGGIQALQAFFEQMSPNSGMAFVVIMHLSPNHESNLAQILQSRTAMPVVQVTETVVVAPNQVYVIPPSRHLLLEDGHIRLVEPQQATGKRLAIDLFFRTLAAAYGPRSVAVVLSGTDGDGSIGIKHVKEQGGLTIAQEPDEAEFDSMPRFAIKTGMVDWVLPVGQMPPRLMEFLRNETRMHIPPEEPQSEADAQAEDKNSGGPPAIRKEASAGDEEALLEVLRFVRVQTGHDFTHYKRATILRRVARRMQVNLLEDIPSYLAFLQAAPEESVSLLHDLLISVTNFFRDAEAFAALRNHVPQLFADKAASDQVRVWVAGCATGEEAYSVAMLLSEQADQLESPPTIQVFATDLDDNAIQVARAGLYPATIEADVSPERLRRFFHREEGGYRVKKELRERVLFSVHNLLKDSPFSRLDMVTCRNLLIYLKREAQEAVFDLFHFALRAGGLLFLGNAESISDGHVLFAPLDRQHRLFVRRSTPRAGWQLPALPVALPSASQPASPPATAPALSAGAETVTSPAWSPPTGQDWEAALGNLHLSLLEKFAPPSLIVNAAYDIVHLSEHVGRFLEFKGALSRNLLRAVHPALRLELQTALFRALHQQMNVSTSAIAVETAGVTSTVTVHVRPANAMGMSEGFVLIVFETSDSAAASPALVPQTPDTMTQHLQAEILHLRQQLSATVEQYESSLEELKASSEEQQSINEEMRSTAEELETSKEELQSTNEELTTVNQELKSNVDELSRANGDLTNLMASTEIGTIFLDRQLRIKRYTPRIRELFNIIPTDVGRPLSDITHKLNYHHFTEDAARVLDTLTRSEREVRNDGHHYLARMLPYRTPDDYIDGVVLTFIDITERTRVEEALRESEERIRIAVDAADMAAWDWDVLANEVHWNAQHFTLFGLQPQERPVSPEVFFRHVHSEDQGWVRERLERSLRDRTVFRAEFRAVREDGRMRWMSGYGGVVREENGKVTRMSGVMLDITPRKTMEEALRLSEERYRLTVENIRDYAIFTLDTEGRVTSWSEGARRVKGYEPEEILGQHFRVFYLPEDQEANKPEHEMERAVATGRNEDESWRVRQDGTRFWGNEITTAVRDESGALQGFVKITRDLTERKQDEQQRLAMEQESTLLQERNRMAQELHDTLAQGFTAIKYQTELAGYSLAETPPDIATAQQYLTRAQELTRQSHQEAGRSVHNLRLPLQESTTLPEAFQRLTTEASDGVEVHFHAEGTTFPLSALVQNDLYRIGQEAVTNALRHSGAQQIDVMLTYFEAEVHLRVEDNGRGFDPGIGRVGFGVTGMQERARRLGADLQISSQPGQGTQIHLIYSIPVGQNRSVT